MTIGNAVGLSEEEVGELSAGSICDLDGDTCIKPELTVGGDEDKLYMEVGGVVVGTLDASEYHMDGIDLRIENPAGGQDLILTFDGGTTPIITRSGAGGSLFFMPGKANPQIVMGDNTTTGAGFLDVDNVKPLNLNTLNDGLVRIGIGGLFMLGDINMEPATQIIVDDGSLAAPGIRFEGANSGIWLDGNSMSFTHNGSDRIQIDSDAIDFKVPLRAQPGTTTLPAYSFNGTGADTGMWWSFGIGLAFTFDGDTKLILTDTDAELQDGVGLAFTEGANSIKFQSPALSADTVYILPDADGTVGQVLGTDGAGNLSWEDAAAEPTDLASVQASNATSAFTIPSTFTDIPFSNTDVENDAAVIEHDNVNTDRIEVSEDGLYMLSYGFSSFFTRAAGSMEVLVSSRIRINDTTVVAGSDTQASNHYSNSANFPEEIYIGKTVVVALSAGDFLSLQAQYDEDTNLVPDVINNSTPISLTVTKLQGTKGDSGLDGAPGSGSSLIAKNEGVNVANTPHSTFNFIGPKVTASDAGGGVLDIEIEAAVTNRVTSLLVDVSASSTEIDPQFLPTISDGLQLGSITITPSSLTAMIAITFQGIGDVDGDRAVSYCLFRGNTFIGVTGQGSVKRGRIGSFSMYKEDFPNTLSAVTYSLRAGSEDGTDWWNNTGLNGDDYGGSAVTKGTLNAREAT